MITDLSQLSRANTVAAMQQDEHLLAANAPPATASTAQTVDANIERRYLANPQALRYSEEAAPTGDTTLLNNKAAQFPSFIYPMMNRIMTKAASLAKSELGGRKLPDDIKPVTLTAIMTPAGKLTEIVIEQRSGVAQVDAIMIEACKQGLWFMNPPAGALSPDHNYRLRIEGAIYNYSYNREDVYVYITHVGLAIM